MNEQIFTKYADVVSVKEMQKMLGIGRNLAYDIIKHNKISHIKLNNKILISKQNIIDFLFDSEVNDER